MHTLPHAAHLSSTARGPIQTPAWDTAYGDFRPINYGLAPFNFPAPAETIELGAPLGGGRPDRSFLLWKMEDALWRNLL